MILTWGNNQNLHHNSGNNEVKGCWLFRSVPCCTFTASFCMACVILLFAVPVEKVTSCQQARAQKVTEFTPQQWEQRAHRLTVISFIVPLCDYFCLLTSLFPLLWCKFCNLLCAYLLANGYFTLVSTQLADDAMAHRRTRSSLPHRLTGDRPGCEHDSSLEESAVRTSPTTVNTSARYTLRSSSTTHPVLLLTPPVLAALSSLSCPQTSMTTIRRRNMRVTSSTARYTLRSSSKRPSVTTPTPSSTSTSVAEGAVVQLYILPTNPIGDVI